VTSSSLGKRRAVGRAVLLMPDLSDQYVLASIEALGFQAGRYAPGLSAFIDLRARLNTLLEVRAAFQDRLSMSCPDAVKKRKAPSSRVVPGFVGPEDEVDYARILRNQILLKLHDLDGQIAMCRDWSSRLDNNCTIDHRFSWLSDFRRYQREWPVRRLFEVFMYERPPCEPDKWAEFLRHASRACRRDEYLARLYVELATAGRDGWFVVFDSCTIDPVK